MISAKQSRENVEIFFSRPHIQEAIRLIDKTIEHASKAGLRNTEVMMVDYLDILDMVSVEKTLETFGYNVWHERIKVSDDCDRYKFIISW